MLWSITSCYCSKKCADEGAITTLYTIDYALSDLNPIAFVQYPKNSDFVNPIDSFQGTVKLFDGTSPQIIIYPDHALSIEYDWIIQIPNRQIKITELQIGYAACQKCLLGPSKDYIELASYQLDSIQFNNNFIVLAK